MFPVSVWRMFKIAMRVSVAESLFMKETCKISTFYKPVKNSIVSFVMFRKVAVLEILKNSLLTRVVSWQSTGMLLKMK